MLVKSFLLHWEHKKERNELSCIERLPTKTKPIALCTSEPLPVEADESSAYLEIDDKYDLQMYAMSSDDWESDESPDSDPDSDYPILKCFFQRAQYAKLKTIDFCYYCVKVSLELKILITAPMFILLA